MTTDAKNVVLTIHQPRVPKRLSIPSSRLASQGTTQNAVATFPSIANASSDRHNNPT